MVPDLSVVRYFFGMGGLLLCFIFFLGVLFVGHVRKSDLNDPIAEAIAMVYIGAMLGLILWFISIPTLCFLRSTYLCYQVM